LTAVGCSEQVGAVAAACAWKGNCGTRSTAMPELRSNAIRRQTISPFFECRVVIDVMEMTPS